MINPTVFIIILNWNGLIDTTECIESLRKIDYNNFQILVVDNGSDSDIKELSDITGIKLIALNKNFGFSGGCNIGINYAVESGADYILLLNNDTTVEPDFLKILSNKLQSDEKIGIVAPQINYYDEPGKIWSAGGKISKIRASGFALENKFENETTSKERSVEFVSGCCMLIRAEVFEKIQKFDENYFLYLEDVDFCKRATDAGYLIILIPSSRIFHKVNAASSKSLPNIPLYYNTRNRLYFTQKFFPKYNKWVYTYLNITMSIKSIFWNLNGDKSKLNFVKEAFNDFKNNKFGKRKNLK